MVLVIIIILVSRKGEGVDDASSLTYEEQLAAEAAAEAEAIAHDNDLV